MYDFHSWRILLQGSYGPGILFFLEKSRNFVCPEKSPVILFVMEKVLDSKDGARNGLPLSTFNLNEASRTAEHLRPSRFYDSNTFSLPELM